MVLLSVLQSTCVVAQRARDTHTTVASTNGDRLVRVEEPISANPDSDYLLA
jgi:hypothetical protein